MDGARIFLIRPAEGLEELQQVPEHVPADSFVWLALERDTFSQHLEEVQRYVSRLTGLTLLDLHVSDLLNLHLPSRFDYTSNYDMLVFRRLGDDDAAASAAASRRPVSAAAVKGSAARGSNEDSVKLGLPATRRVGTVPVGFVVFDRVLLSIHPARCSVLHAYIARLTMLASSIGGTRTAGLPASAARLPDSPAELMLRMVSLMVDAYLDLRKTMTRQLDRWQQRLLQTNARFDDWDGLLLSRQTLHHLYDICEDQRSAVGRWMDILEDEPAPANVQAQHAHDQLLVRSRDVIEHIERVSHHVRQLEQSAETAIQIHFNIQNNRTNAVMRALTAITAVFLPLNLIASVFGMNFEFIPWLHTREGFWGALALMAFIAVALPWGRRRRSICKTRVLLPFMSPRPGRG